MFGLYPPQLQFTVSVVVQRLAYNKLNGEEVWEDVSRVEVGPQKRIASSSEYLASCFSYA